LKTLTGHKKWVRCVAFNTDGFLASGSHDNSVRIWNVSTGECLKTLTGHENSVWGVAFNTDGLLASGSGDNSVRIWG